jgi:hypothetical protein
MSRGFKIDSAAALLVVLGTACNNPFQKAGGPNTPIPAPTGGINVSGCTAAPSSGFWVPNVPGVSSANHDSTVQVSKTSQSVLAPLSGLADSITGREVTVQFTVGQDLGLNGSVTLLGQVSGYPSAITPTAYPILTYLSDGTNEYINLTRGGAGDCSGIGFFSCSAGNCNSNPGCGVGFPSAYTDFTHFWMHQIPNWGHESVNTFPTCRWTGGSSSWSLDPECAFNTYLSSTSGHLPVGTYTARYFLIADGYPTVPVGNNATLTVSVVEKKAATNPASGAVDINVILVGSHNISDSHTVAGQRNLNTMATALGTYLGNANSNIKLGQVNVYELTCQEGGEALATISSDEVGILLQTGSALVNPVSEGKAINVFMISEFSDSNAILGIDGSIGAPPINGLQTSGLVVATYNSLQSFNAACRASPCPLNSQDSDFYEMGNTMAHEIGHFMGLNHPSEGTGQTHDFVYDTPYCTAVDQGTGSISISSCLSSDTSIYAPTGNTCQSQCTSYNANASPAVFCPAVEECAFNYMMWYTSKHFDPATGNADGNMYSPDQGIIMNFSSVVQ